MKPNLNHLLLCYVLIAIVTFGAVWNEYCPNVPTDLKAIASFVTSAAWPLYWSAKIWARKEML